MYVCSCRAITEADVRRLARLGLRPTAIAEAFGLDEPGCCGRCLRDLERLAVISEDAILEPAVALSR